LPDLNLNAFVRGMTMNESIIIVESTDMPKNSEVVFDKLMSMLNSSGCVKDIETVESDIKARDWVSGSGTRNNLCMHHAKTDGVSGFCAAVIMYPGNVAHGVFAWPENTDSNLQLIATVFDRMEKIQLKRQHRKAA